MRFNEATRAQLDQIAYETDRKLSEVIRDLVDESLERRTQ